MWIILACGSGVRTGTITSNKRKREQRKKKWGIGNNFAPPAPGDPSEVLQNSPFQAKPTTNAVVRITKE